MVKLPPFLVEQIEEDLAKIDSISLDSAWKLLKENPHYVRYKSIGGRLYSSSKMSRNHPRYIVITQGLEAVHSKDFDLIVCLKDCLDSNEHPAPIFTFSTKKGKKNLILMPDCEALNRTDRNYLTSMITKSSKKISWEEKEEKAFWRGSPTGKKLTLQQIESNEWKIAPRFQLVLQSESRPDLIDAAFIPPTVGSYMEMYDHLAKRFHFGSPIHPKEHLTRKYLLDLDGNACCYSRTFWILLSNSLLVKQVTPNIQWYYRGLKAHKHYIQINEDLSNLQETIEWCRLHDEECRQIAINGTEFSLKTLQYEMNLTYLDTLLKGYAQKTKVTPILDSEDTPAKVPFKTEAIHLIKGFLRKTLRAKPIA